MSPMAVLEAPALSSSIRPRMPRLLSVRCSTSCIGKIADASLAKFTGYQYGGRPLGLTFVKYQTPGDAMEGTDQIGGMTQDQIM